MIFILGLLLVFAIVLLGLAVEQGSVIDAHFFRDTMLRTQTFYTAESGLTMFRTQVEDDFTMWEHDADAPGGAPGLAGCLAGPCYLTWATREHDHALRLHSLARAMAPTTRAACPLGRLGSLVEVTLRREHHGEAEQITPSDWRHTPCPFSSP